MSVAGASVADPIGVASATGRALPRRFLALVFDTLVISVLDAILNGTFGVERVTNGVATTMGSGGFTSFTTQTTVDWPWLALLWVTYYAVLEGLFGATIGKGLARLRVTDLEGRRIGLQAAVVRNLARLLDVLPFGYLLGGILVLEPGVRRRRAVGVAAVTALLLVFCAGFAYFGRPPLVIEGNKNTSNGIFSQGVSSYTLGSPRWGTGEVTYPITYELARTTQTCRGQITLDWNWGVLGWLFSSGETQCSPQIYP
jgi:uncharacterized RDD family membrane protein YckC